MSKKGLDASYMKKRASSLFNVFTPTNSSQFKNRKSALLEENVEFTETYPVSFSDSGFCHPLSLHDSTKTEEYHNFYQLEIATPPSSIHEVSSVASKKSNFGKRSFSQGNLLSVWTNNKVHHETTTSLASRSDLFLRELDAQKAPSKKSQFQKRESKAIRFWQSKTVENMLIQDNLSPLSVDDCTERDQMIARFIISELQSTEKSFYQFLLFIKSNYMEPMLEKVSQSRYTLFKSNDVHALFYHLPDLISVASRTLKKLEEYDILDCPGLTIGRIFKELEQDFVIFLKYAVHYQGNLKAIRRASLSCCSKAQKTDDNRLGMSDYLIAPFQRVPRYELLLKDLLKYTKNQHQDLIYAKNMISGLASTMNQVQQKISITKPYF
ncbi:Dbl homology domain-containing protein [Blakeslea trispora]|nr:Dbl homology domain-containing protein [Blakeslea trispora]